ncbi:MAG: radical SAM protein [Candidatus Cloacimonetes bacterium]|nr:radical SAM protein [Candidatus Cloacimonadota bacterium]
MVVNKFSGSNSSKVHSDLSMNGNRLSIILNYGCPYKCSYCIWKKHRLENYSSSPETFDYEYLFSLLSSGFFSGYVSVSGGGDPLYNINPGSTQSILLHRIHRFTQYFGYNLSIHTRIREFRIEVVNLADQFIVSYDDLNEKDLQRFVLFLKSRNKQVRLAKVATEEDYDYLRDINFARMHNFKITFYAKDRIKATWFSELKEKLENDYSRLVFMEKGNIHYYLLPDNKLYRDYSANVLAEILYKESEIG